MESIRSFLKKWGVTITIVGSVIAVGFGLGQCTYDLTTRKVEVEVQVPERTEDLPAEVKDPVEEVKASDAVESTSK